jgi:Secretion system C-terminal sorting domain
MQNFFTPFLAVKPFVFIPKTSVCLLVLMLWVLQNISAQVSFTAADVPVTENFNQTDFNVTAFNLTDNTSIPGVYARRAVGNATPNVIARTAGGASGGNLYHFGTASTDADRALGSIQSTATGVLNYGIRYKNNTGSIITSLIVTYTGEEWRTNAATASTPMPPANVLSFDYRQAPTVTDLTTGTFTSVSALNFTSPVTSTATTGTALNGNDPANRVTLTATITVTIPAGEEILLRWTDVDEDGVDCGMAIDDISVTPKAATNYYYKGSGSLASTSSWGTSSNGGGANPPNFTNDYQLFIITNTTAVTLDAVWTVSGASKVILGNLTSPSAAITLTLPTGTSIETPTIGFDVAAPSSGNHKIIYQNSTAISIGAINDPNLELVYDGATLSTSTSKTYGNVSLINNATVDMSNAAIVVKNLTIDAGSSLSGAYSSTRYLAIKSGGSVVINGTFKTGRPGGLVSANIPIPVTTSTANNALLFEGSESLTIGAASTIDYYRGTSGNTGVQTIEARTYNNLMLSNSGVSNNKIFAAGTTTVSGNLTINTFAGTETATLSGNVTTNTLTLTSGKVLLGANNLTTNTISGGSNACFVVTDGAGTLTRNNFTGATTFPVGTTTTDYAPATVTNNASARNFAVKVGPTVTTPLDATKIVNLQWDILPSNASGNNADLTLQWNTAHQAAAFNAAANVYMGHYNGSFWDLAKLSTVAGASPYTATATGFTNFTTPSLFALGNVNAIVIPIELTKFDVKTNQKTALLTWATASEKDNAAFNIEQSTNGTDFQTVGEVKGHGTTSAPMSYSFEHNTPSVGINYYRLKQVDFNGLATYSPVRSALFGKNGLVIKTTLVQETLEIITSDDILGPLPIATGQVRIFNISGQQVLSLKGQGAQSINVSTLPAGLYIIQTQTGEVARFVKI